MACAYLTHPKKHPNVAALDLRKLPECKQGCRSGCSCSNFIFSRMGSNDLLLKHWPNPAHFLSALQFDHNSNKFKSEESNKGRTSQSYEPSGGSPSRTQRESSEVVIVPPQRLSPQGFAQHQFEDTRKSPLSTSSSNRSSPLNGGYRSPNFSGGMAVDVYGHQTFNATPFPNQHLSQGMVSPSNLPRGTVSPPHLPQGMTSPSNLPRGTVSPPNLPQGMASPPHLPQGMVSPPHLPQGMVSPPHLPQGMVSPSNLSQGMVSPLHLQHGMVSPPHLQQGMVSLNAWFSLHPSTVSPSSRLSSPDQPMSSEVSNRDTRSSSPVSRSSSSPDLHNTSLKKRTAPSDLNDKNSINLQRRIRNNLAAKRSRDLRREREDKLAVECLRVFNFRKQLLYYRSEYMKLLS